MPNPLIERMARAICEASGHEWREGHYYASSGPNFDNEAHSADELNNHWRHKARAALSAIQEPSEEQWDGLTRQIILWMDMTPKTPRALFAHLKASGYDIPQWLRNEPEMERLDHVPSKGARAVMIYKAMMDAALA